MSVGLRFEDLLGHFSRLLGNLFWSHGCECLGHGLSQLALAVLSAVADVDAMFDKYQEVRQVEKEKR